VGGREAGLQLPEYAVFSGDTVRRDAEGFLYFIGRRDEMMKTSGYRVSPTEVEEVLYATQLVGECVAFGVDHPRWARPSRSSPRPDGSARSTWPRCWPVPASAHAGLHGAGTGIEVPGPLPRNPNGKIDRKLLATAWVERPNPG
jgi:acyl-coenzyme A synthetase/AMP-(fatty) acid ligase